MAGGGSIRLGLVGIAAAIPCASAHAQSAPTFPSATDRAALVGWLRQETDIAPAQVVAVSNAAVTAVMGTIDTQSPRGARLSLRAEAIDPQISGREGVLSWHMVVEADCAGRKLRMGATTGYAGRNLLGEGREIRPGTDAWSEPKAGSQLENVWRSACEPNFQRPLATTRVAAAAGTQAAARSPQPPAAQPQLRAMLLQAPAPKSRVAATPAQRAPQATPIAVATSPRPENPLPTTRSSATVQVAATATRPAAEAFLAHLRTRFADAMSGLSTKVNPATVGGKTVYRALVTGFARAADANEFCSGMKAGGVGCLVRGR